MFREGFLFFSPFKKKKRVMNYFKSVEETFSNQNFNTRISTDNQRFKAHYNSLKSCLLLESVGEKARIIDLGCGKGSDLLKSQVHQPNAVVHVDNA